MNKNINKNWFTLIELLVGISIITILVLWWSNIAYRNISDKQKLEIFNNRIIWEIEEVRNNSMIWKWIWTNLTVPPEWKIEFSRNSWWKIITSYSWATWTEYKNIEMDNFINISSISCKNISWTTQNLTATQTWTIIFKWWKYSLWWNCPSTYSNITIQTYSKWFYNNVAFDTISWLIKK